MNKDYTWKLIIESTHNNEMCSKFVDWGKRSWVFTAILVALADWNTDNYYYHEDFPNQEAYRELTQVY